MVVVIIIGGCITLREVVLLRLVLLADKVPDSLLQLLFLMIAKKRIYLAPVRSTTKMTKMMKVLQDLLLVVNEEEQNKMAFDIVDGWQVAGPHSSHLHLLRLHAMPLTLSYVHFNAKSVKNAREGIRRLTDERLSSNLDAVTGRSGLEMEEDWVLSI